MWYVELTNVLKSLNDCLWYCKDLLKAKTEHLESETNINRKTLEMMNNEQH